MEHHWCNTAGTFHDAVSSRFYFGCFVTIVAVEFFNGLLINDLWI